VSPLWFQLYPTTNRQITEGLLRRAESAGCEVVALTIDTPVLGNRERHGTKLAAMLESGELPLGNYEGLGEFENEFDPTMTWDMVGWLHDHCDMRVVLKGVVTAEDAELAVAHGADGLIVSNHGGRQEESDRSTIECLPEVAAAVDGACPVLIDGGFRRGTDVFKALALGADAVCIGRPYIWGLSAFGQQGVEHALDLLDAELIRIMQLAGVTTIADIDAGFVTA
jgi:isopentenyl diphosphate isomerase/L-lactate dehydrogenase-like FMN-dependent dehydrogenase